MTEPSTIQDITPEMARAELARRQAAQVTSVEQITPEMARAELTRRERLNGPTKKKESGWEDFAEGLAVSGMDTYYGMKSLFGKLDDEDRATLRDWKADAGESGWGTAGQITGEVAQLVLPGGVAVKGLKAAGKARGLARATAAAAKVSGAPIKTAATTAAGLGAMRAKNEDPEASRLSAALMEGGMALAGGGAGKLLGKAVTGAAKSPEAARMAELGVDLTASKSAETALFTSWETLMRTMPGLAKPVRDRAATMLLQWNKAMIRKAAPEGASVSTVGAQGVDDLYKAYQTGYSNAWRGADTLTKAGQKKFKRAATDGLEDVIGADRAVIKGAIKRYEKFLAGEGRYSAHDIDEYLRGSLKGDITSGLRESLKELRVALRAGLRAPKRRALETLDNTYARYKVVEDASNQAIRTNNIFTPDVFMGSVKKIGRKTGARGLAPMQQLGKDAEATLGREEPKIILDRLKGMIQSVPGPTRALEGVGRAAMGDTAIQQVAQRVLSPAAKALRDQGVSAGAALGAASYR